MEGKMEKLQDVRSRVQNLDLRQDNFPEKLRGLSQETLGYLEAPGDEQEINWTKSAMEISESLRGVDVSSEEIKDKKDLGLRYLNEALDSVVIRERNYLE